MIESILADTLNGAAEFEVLTTKVLQCGLLRVEELQCFMKTIKADTSSYCLIIFNISPRSLRNTQRSQRSWAFGKVRNNSFLIDCISVLSKKVRQSSQSPTRFACENRGEGNRKREAGSPHVTSDLRHANLSEYQSRQRRLFWCAKWIDGCVQCIYMWIKTREKKTPREKLQHEQKFSSLSSQSWMKNCFT